MTIQVPDFAATYGLEPDEVEQRVRERLVLSLFTEERISSGKAATLLGISRVAFLGLLHRRRIAYLDLSPEELEADLQALKQT
jgi:predicted HTH domain antitoxin